MACCRAGAKAPRPAESEHASHAKRSAPSRKARSSWMSRLRSPNGDDHPDAAQKHLLDVEVLLAQGRLDGAAYLSGYVVECSLKSLHVLETGRDLRGHHLQTLVGEVNAVATVAGAKTAKYLG